MEQSISQFKSLQEISALRFHEIKFSGNIKLIDKDYEEGKSYELHEIHQMHQTWLSLYDEYFEKTDDTKFKKELKNKDQNLELLLTINTTERIVSLLEYNELNVDYLPDNIYMENKVAFGNALKQIDKKLEFDSNTETKPQLDKVKTYLSGLKTRYELNFKEDLVVEQKDILRYYEIKTQIAEILEMNDIPDYINMLQWIVYEKNARKRASNEQRNTRKGRTSRNNNPMGKP